MLDLVTTVLTEHGLTIGLASARRDLEAIHERYAPPRGGFWVAELEGQVVGTIAVRPKEDATCELKRLYVRSSARGRGLGRALYAHAEAFAKSAGYSKIWLDSSRRFQEARKLYERSGFVLVEEIDNEWEDNVYEKDLLGGPSLRSG